jgi:hypothetical protein
LQYFVRQIRRLVDQLQVQVPGFFLDRRCHRFEVELAFLLDDQEAFFRAGVVNHVLHELIDEPLEVNFS